MDDEYGISKLDKAVRLLNQRGVDGLIIYSNGANTMARPFLRYFAGFKPMGKNNAAVISKSGDIALLVEPRWDAIRASDESWVSEVTGTSDFRKDLVDIMRQFKISGSVGIAGSTEMKEEAYTAIKNEVAIRLADDIIGEIAREKTREEMDNVKTVARIADAGFKAFLKYARPGIREYELAAEIDFVMRAAGAEDGFVLLSSGEHNHAIHSPTDRRLLQGDTVIAEITPNRNAQAIQLCRTAVMGKPNPTLADKYKLLSYSFEESLKYIKAVAPASVISKAINKVISDAGYGKYCYPPYMRARGHGCGIGSIVGPVDLGQLDDSNEVRLQKNQVLVVHPNQYFPETGYLACGETVMVTETGVARLSETESKLYVQGV